MAINLQEFLDGYKTSEVELWDKKWKFREPKMKDVNLSVMQILENYCIEWSWEEFKEIINNDLPISKQKEIIENILKDLGLV